jgi:hypothetical protein
MAKLGLWSGVSLGVLLALGAGRASALPGQTTEEVAAWIQAHPTLRPASGERLLVRKSDTAARRFTFQASILQPGRVVPARDAGVIRTERMTLFDIANGVTPERLEESLRVIYGLDVFQDYERARVVYAYPGPMTAIQARRQNTPLRTALQGEIKQGNRYAYWMELAQNPNGKTYTGQMTVFLKDDLTKLETELRNRR